MRARTVGATGDTTNESPVLSIAFRLDKPLLTLEIHQWRPPIMIHVPLVKHCMSLIPKKHHI